MSKSEIQWFSVIADDQVIGVIPRRNLKKEEARLSFLHGIKIRPATIKEQRKYAPAPSKERAEPKGLFPEKDAWSPDHNGGPF